MGRTGPYVYVMRHGELSPPAWCPLIADMKKQGYNVVVSASAPCRVGRGKACENPEIDVNDV